MLLKPLAYADADRIVMVMEKPPTGERNGISTLNYLDWKSQNGVFEYMTEFDSGVATLTGRGGPVRLRRDRVAPEYFNIFGVHAALGRTLVAGEDQPGENQVVVLNHALWETQFGGDPKLIGQTIRLDGEPYTVVGVLPAGGSFDRLAAQFYTPLVFKPENMTRNFHWLVSFAKLKPRVTLAAARQEMNTIGARMARDYPDSNKGWGVVVDHYSDILAGPGFKQSLYILLARGGDGALHQLREHRESRAGSWRGARSRNRSHYTDGMLCACSPGHPGRPRRRIAIRIVRVHPADAAVKNESY